MIKILSVEDLLQLVVNELKIFHKDKDEKFFTVTFSSRMTSNMMIIVISHLFVFTDKYHQNKLFFFYFEKQNYVFIIFDTVAFRITNNIVIL
jgi:hypothetical protein